MRPIALWRFIPPLCLALFGGAGWAISSRYYCDLSVRPNRTEYGVISRNCTIVFFRMTDSRYVRSTWMWTAGYRRAWAVTSLDEKPRFLGASAGASRPDFHFVLIPYAWLLLVGVVWGAWRFWRLRPAPAPDHPICTKCGYDLRAHKSGDRCPECGTVVPPRLPRSDGNEPSSAL